MAGSTSTPKRTQQVIKLKNKRGTSVTYYDIKSYIPIQEQSQKVSAEAQVVSGFKFARFGSQLPHGSVGG